MITKFQRAETVRPISTTLYINCIVWVKGLHQHLKSICRKHICHETKDTQPLLETQLLVLTFACPNFGEMKFRIFESKFFKKRESIR